MTEKTTLETLKAARKLIEIPEHWCQENYAQDGDDRRVGPNSYKAYAFCGVGALCRATKKGALTILWHPAYAALELGLANGEDITDFNDTHTHAEVLQAFDQAIAKLEATHEPKVN